MKKILLGFIAIGLLTFVGCEKEKQKGCTEPNAINFDSAAEENDGSCRYEEDNNNDSNSDQDSTGTNNGGTETDSTGINNGGTDTDSTGTNNGGTDTDSTEIVISLPTLTTTAVSSITEKSAVSGGNITNNGGATVTSRGVCWGTSANPTIYHNRTTNGIQGIGNFTSNLTGLSKNITYYVRAYAINSAGTAYGNKVSFIAKKPVEYGNGVADIDGNSYQTVIIGNQEWMAENLKTTKYADGTTIPNVTDDGQWANLSTGAWCNNDNSSSNDATYGKLYNWYAVNTNKLCPTGWHVPTEAEWTVLTDYLAANGHSGSEGTALKATSGWNSGGNGTDDYGFLGLPGGYRFYHNGYFKGIGGYCLWWSSSQDSTGNAWLLHLGSNYGHVNSYGNNKKNGYSVRCLRD